jgi:predicted nuclease of restriction endonuclease-like (RecB) superfamily
VDALRPAAARSELHAREFYAREALAGGWSVRQLDRQINSQFYERTALSKNKTAMLLKGEKPKPGMLFPLTRKSAIRSCSNFLASKTNTPKAIWKTRSSAPRNFPARTRQRICLCRQTKRLRIGHEWFRVDLVFFHRRLRCLVIIDLKIAELVHTDIGQMNLYCNFAREHWMQPGENPPVGLILCAGKDDALARYAMEGLHNKMLVREYLTALPKESALAAEVGRTRELLERNAEQRRMARKITHRLRSAVGEREKWSGDGETASGTKSKRNAAAGRRRKPAAAAAISMPLVTSARICVVERASSRGIRGDGQPVERSKPRAFFGFYNVATKASVS